LLRPFNLLVLDEPTNHLDIISKDILKQAVNEYDGTLIVVSHDREFLAGIAQRTIEFRDRQLFEYLGDVNFFLEKRALRNMREVEMSRAKNVAAATAAAAATTELSHEDRKRLARALQNAERAVEKIEENIAAIELQMADPSFYERPDTEQVMEQYRRKKKELEAAMEQWEEAQMAAEGVI
jgi:ATP-binding cassette, subfamily F, member 3